LSDFVHGDVAPGLDQVSDKEGSSVWGKGYVGIGNADSTTSKNKNALADHDCHGMPSYNVKALLVSLNLADTPLFYQPPIGRSIDFTVRYNHRDANQPDVFTYWNFGPKWSSDWLSFIVDDPTSYSADLKVYVNGGMETSPILLHP